jgi:Sec-independent protein translocase protein TatA
VLFGGGKISGLGREAGQFITNFRKQLNSNDPS